MTPDDAAALAREAKAAGRIVYLEGGKADLPALLGLNVPFKNSSVPADPASALRYAHRLELRYKADQQHLIAVRRHLSFADTLLQEMIADPEPSSRISLGMALGFVQAAKEETLS